MANVSEVDNTTPFSTYNHIDALLDSGPHWNFVTGTTNTLKYTFSVTSGLESTKTGQAAFSDAQMGHARAAMAYLSTVTGIVFTETSDGAAADIHLANINIDGASTSGLCSWLTSFKFNTGNNELTSYSASAYVYLDNVEWKTENANLTPGTYGYETLLHELGHMLGLKHPFEETPRLPASTDNTSFTVMAYTESGGPYSTFREYDIAALNWLYGGDGLRGALGINSTTGGRYLTGTNVVDTLVGTANADRLDGNAGNDSLTGGGGNDTINGGDGVDIVVFTGGRSNYIITKAASGYKVVDVRTSGDGTDSVATAESLKFSDASLQVQYDSAVQALYLAYFGRAADFSGLANFQSQMTALGAPQAFSGLEAAYKTNAGIRSLIDSFSSSGESTTLYGGDTGTFVRGVYQNLFNRAPDTEGLNFWAGAIASGDLSRSNAALSIMSGALLNTSAQGLLDAAMVNNKTAVASNFTFALNTSVRAGAFSGDTAAASVRSMLGTVTSTTDTVAFQATIDSVIASLVAAKPALASDPVDDSITQFDDIITLVGVVPPPDVGFWLA
jgi:serralysin